MIHVNAQTTSFEVVENARLLVIEKPTCLEQDFFDRRMLAWKAIDRRQQLWAMAQAFAKTEKYLSVKEEFSRRVNNVAARGMGVDLDQDTYDRIAVNPSMIGFERAVKDAIALVDFNWKNDMFGKEGYPNYALNSNPFAAFQFANFIVLNELGIVPGDLVQSLDVGEEFYAELMEYQTLVTPDSTVVKITDRDTVDEAMHWKIVAIMRGYNRKKVILGTPFSRKVRRFANLTASAHRDRYDAKPHGFLRSVNSSGSKPEFFEMLGDEVFTKTLRDWSTFGACGIYEILDSRADWRIYPQVIPVKFPPVSYPIRLNELQSPYTKELYDAVFDTALGYYPTWPKFQIDVIDVMRPRLYTNSPRGFDQWAWKKGNITSPPRIDTFELELMGRIITEGSPTMRELFWVALYHVHHGFRVPHANHLKPNYQTDAAKPLEQVIMRSACEMVKAGYALNQRVSLVDYGRGGIRPVGTFVSWFSTDLKRVVSIGLSAF